MSDRASVAGSEASKEKKGGIKGLFGKVKETFNDARSDFSALKTALEVEGSITKDLKDVSKFPEVAHVAEVRRGAEISPSEKAFVYDRKIHARNAFAKYMNLDPNSVHPEDVPTIGFGGSGGGFRAMLGCAAYCEELKRTGIWDLLTYVSGVSGSCWALAAYYTFGETSMTKVVDHCKKRLNPDHPLSPDAVRKLLKAKPYATLGPIIAKRESGLHTVTMDLYSVFTTGYVFLVDDPITGGPGHTPQKEVAGYHQDWYKWTSALQHIRGGAEPMPILTAIRHERPWKDWHDAEHPFKEDDPTKKEHEDAQDAWFQWFEITPLEVGCDELACWVPTWGFGRPFEEGKSTMQLPEQSLALLLGLCTSAPAGPMTSYLATIKRQLPTGFIGDAINGISKSIQKAWGKQGTEVFQQHHPLHAVNEHNFMYHLTPTPKGTERPAGIENSPRIHLIDSGMDNNCPTYVLLHPDREVDVILNMDASSDVQKGTFQERVDQIGSRRGLRFRRRHDLSPDPDTKNPDRWQGLYAQIYDGVLCGRPETVTDSYGHTVTNPPAPVCHQENTMVYMPLLPNERAVPDFDPSTAKFSGSYNLVWTAEQVEMLAKVCKQNFLDGQEAVQTAIMDAYYRKKAKREGTFDNGGYSAGSRPLHIGQQPASQNSSQAPPTITEQQLPGPPPGPPPPQAQNFSSGAVNNGLAQGIHNVSLDSQTKPDQAQSHTGYVPHAGYQQR